MISASVAKETEKNSALPKLNLMEKAMLLRGTVDTNYFKERTRPMLYGKCKDAERVHELVLHASHEYGNASQFLAPFFKPPKNVMIKVNGVEISPFGTAAGMDKDGEAFAAFGYIYGFQEAGTVTVNPRPGNDRIRMASIDGSRDIINACGFPSKGLDNFLANISEYRKHGGKARIYASICGLPLCDDNAVTTAKNEMAILIKSLNPYVDGFVWDPSSPNTTALGRIMNPAVFFETAGLMLRLTTHDKLKLVKLPPYEPKDKYVIMELVGSFMEGGGHGVVTTNTKMLGKDQIPESTRGGWGYTSAGISGASLKEYRLRSVHDIRYNFRDAVIVATGGIYDAQDAYDTFCAGANMLEGFTPYAYFGPGLVKKIMGGVSDIMTCEGISLRRLQEEVEDGAKFGRGRFKSRHASQ
jgi:dihydroorotate dehydrogenase